MIRYILSIFALFIFYLFYSCRCSEHFENVARGKTCDQSSIGRFSHPSNYAVNGNTNGTYWERPNCIHTVYYDRSPWWQVNLGRPYPVYTIVVWARTGYVHRMSERVITVDGAECYRFPQLPNDNTLRKQTVNCTHGVLNGTIVRLARDRNTGQSADNLTINLCEFEVISCSDEYWGNDCSKRCGDCRSGVPCDKVTGYCEECVDGRHGEKCDKNCSVNCAGTCDQNTGNCHSCRQPGVQLPLCSTECADGLYGPNCSQRCSENCANVSCSWNGGHCACKPGWMPPGCRVKCSKWTYGVNCDEKCGNCRNATDCLPDSGFCTNGCAEGFTGSRCTEVRSSDSQNRVAEFAGPFVGGFALCALISIVSILVVIVRRRHRMATRTAAPEEGEGTSSDETHFGNHNYDDVDQDSGQASNPQENPAFEMLQGSPQAAYDASNYERLEIYENRKEITNVYTGLT